jgi:hypothetical protein
MTTRDKYKKVNCEVGLSLDGQELPNMSVLGAALEEATALIQQRVTESYQEVPARQPEPVVAAVVRSDPAAAMAATAAHVNEQPVPATEPEEKLEPVPFGKPWEIGRS